MQNLTSPAAAAATLCTCPTHCPPEGLESRQQKLAAERLRALITIDCHAGFKPQSARSQPEGTIGTNLSKEVALEFAITYNESAHSIRKSRWAVVTTGGALLLLPIDPEHRPPSPWMFHPAARELPDSDHESAQELAAVENAPRFEQAQIPRNWTVPLMNLQPTWLKREARRAAGLLNSAEPELQTA